MYIDIMKGLTFKNSFSDLSINHFISEIQPFAKMFSSQKNFQLIAKTFFNFIDERPLKYTVKSLFAAAATIHFGEILVQILLSKNYVLLRLLFKGGYYLRAATNNDFTVIDLQKK